MHSGINVINRNDTFDEHSFTRYKKRRSVNICRVIMRKLHARNERAMFLRRCVKTWSPLRYTRNDDLLGFIYSYVKSLFRSSTAFPRNNRYTVLSAREYLLYNQIRFDLSACTEDRNGARIPPPFRFIRGNESIDRRNRKCFDKTVSRAKHPWRMGGKISRFGQVKGEDTFVAWNQREERFSNNFEKEITEQRDFSSRFPSGDSIWK